MSTAALNRRISALEKVKPPATGPQIVRIMAFGQRNPAACIVVRRTGA